MKSSIDKIGILASGLCLIHCLLTPLIFTLFPLLHIIGNHEATIHIAMIIMLIPFSALALLNGEKIFWWLKFIFITSGLSLLVIGIYAEQNIQHNHSLQHDSLTMGGSLLLILAHMIGMKQCRTLKKL